jgi:polyisoprenoid-binding protein YceI
MDTQLETDRGIVRVPTGTWTVDASHSSVEFKVKHMMVSTVRGRFGEFEGTIAAAPDYKDSTVRGSIQAASIDTNEPRRDEHLRSADFFDVENNPTIEFASTRIEHAARGDYRVTGDLTMHGETHPVTFDVTVHGVTRDAQGQDRVGFEARGTLNRSDFGLRWQQALETGGVLVGDEVRISADMAAVCTERES